MAVCAAREVQQLEDFINQTLHRPVHWATKRWEFRVHAPLPTRAEVTRGWRHLTYSCNYGYHRLKPLYTHAGITLTVCCWLNVLRLDFHQALIVFTWSHRVRIKCTQIFSRVAPQVPKKYMFSFFHNLFLHLCAHKIKINLGNHLFQ